MMTFYDPKGPQCLREGRFNPGEDRCALWWSGSGIRARLDGARLEVEAEAPGDIHTPWLMVTVDGEPAVRLPLRPGRHRYDLLGTLEPGTVHEIAILRDTQPTDCDTAPLVINGLYAEGTLSAPEPRPRLVEFLGDSLTVGEGTVGPRDAMEWRMVWISNQFAFPALAARALNAEKRLVALGGWGAYLSFDADPTHTIGGIYDRLCAVVPGGDVPYDFDAQRPADAVVINLGTNDASGLDKLDPALRAEGLSAFEDSAVRLMAQVRDHNPGAAILWAYGLCGGAMEAPLRRAVERRRAAGDGRTFYLALDDCAGDLGSRSHPGRAAHQRAAAQIAEALREIL